MKLLVASVLLVFLACPKESISIPVVQVDEPVPHVSPTKDNPLTNDKEALMQQIMHLVQEGDSLIKEILETGAEDAKGEIQKLEAEFKALKQGLHFVLTSDKEVVLQQMKSLLEEAKLLAKNLSEDEQADVQKAIEQIEEGLHKVCAATTGDYKQVVQDLKVLLQDAELAIGKIKETASEDAQKDLPVVKSELTKVLQTLNALHDILQGRLPEKITSHFHEAKSLIDNIKSKVPEAEHEVYNKVKSVVDKLEHLLHLPKLKKRSPVLSLVSNLLSATPVGGLLGGGLLRKKRSPEPEPLLPGLSVGGLTSNLPLVDGVVSSATHGLVPEVLNAVPEVVDGVLQPVGDVLNSVPVGGLLGGGLLRKKRSPVVGGLLQPVNGLLSNVPVVDGLLQPVGGLLSNVPLRKKRSPVVSGLLQPVNGLLSNVPVVDGLLQPVGGLLSNVPLRKKRSPVVSGLLQPVNGLLSNVPVLNGLL